MTMNTQNTLTSQSEIGARTMRSTLLAVCSLLALAACAEPGPVRNRVQANLVDKSIFEGDWWYTRTVVGLDNDVGFGIAEAGAGAPWVGATADFDIISNSGNIGRIRWVIDENYLYAYRSHEIITGGAANPDDPSYRGQPLAIFAIDKHADVRQE